MLSANPSMPVRGDDRNWLSLIPALCMSPVIQGFTIVKTKNMSNRALPYQVLVPAFSMTFSSVAMFQVLISCVMGQWAQGSRWLMGLGAKGYQSEKREEVRIVTEEAEEIRP
jgi:hypothetical protein